MFNKLRLKLTLTNVAVVSIIFVAVISGIFLMMQKVTHDQTQQFIDLVSANAGIATGPAKSEHKKHEEYQYRYFYVKLNATGDVLSASEGPDIKNDDVKNMIAEALASSKQDGKVELGEQSYIFRKSTLKNAFGTFIVFVNTHPENEILGDLFIVLAVTGALGLIFAFLGSLYMANRSLIPIKESWNQQKNFIADASHELRTPLSVIETTLDLLESKKDKTIESQLKWIENIQAENKRMSRLVSDMLFLARTDSDQVLLEMKTFSLNAALLEAYIPFEAVAMQKGIQLDPFEGPEVEFYGDEARIKQLAVILIDNALKYTPAGGRVGICLKDLGEAVEMIFTDTGVGIDKEHINKVFQRFYRVDKARSRNEGSVGLGLSIADWIVKQHHGHIRVESSKGMGSTFHIYLPIQK